MIKIVMYGLVLVQNIRRRMAVASMTRSVVVKSMPKIMVTLLRVILEASTNRQRHQVS